MNEVELEHPEDQPAAGWVPWLTARRSLVFTLAWLLMFGWFSAFVSNPFQSEPNAAAGPTYANVMFLHGLLIGMVGLIALLVLHVMRIKSVHIRAWIVLGVVAATILAGVGGLFDKALPGDEVALWTQIVGFFFLDEILISLIVGIASEKSRIREIGWLPFATGIAAAASALAAAIMGHMAGWIVEFGNSPAFIGSYAKAVGFDKVGDFRDALIGSHSHEMAVACMALGITILAVHFGYSKLRGGSRTLAQVGLGMVGGGVVLMSLYYILTGAINWGWLANVQFGTDPNLIPLDDALTGLFVMGGGVVTILGFLPDLFKAPVRLAAAWSYVLAMATVAVGGYAVELNETVFGAGDPKAVAAAADGIFTWLHQDVGLFLLPTLLIVMLAADALILNHERTNRMGILALIGSTVLYIGVLLWVFVNPAHFGIAYWVSTVGVLCIGGALVDVVWHMGFSREEYEREVTSARLTPAVHAH